MLTMGERFARCQEKLLSHIALCQQIDFQATLNRNYLVFYRFAGNYAELTLSLSMGSVVRFRGNDIHPIKC